MILSKIKRALERRLSTLTPAIPTAYGNAVYKPVANQPYQRVVFVPRNPNNSTLGSDFYLEQGEFQIFLAYPKNAGEADALDRADAIRSLFKRGTFMLEGDVRVHILGTPSVRGSAVIEDRLVIPIIVNFEAEVYSV